MKKLIITSIFFILTISINAQNWFGKRIRGNGHVVTKVRETSEYNAISIGGSFDVVLVKGKEGKITIKGEENIIDVIITEVKGGTLKVKFKNNVNIRITKRLTITIPFNEIEAISLGGSGNLKSEDVIKADNIKLSLGGSGNIYAIVNANNVKSSIGGSGNIKISGTTDKFTCSIAGSGSIKAYGLQANTINAKIAGSGSIKTTVKNKIKAKVVGSGNIYYKGNPKYINSKSIGSGDVIDRN